MQFLYCCRGAVWLFRDRRTKSATRFVVWVILRVINTLYQKENTNKYKVSCVSVFVVWIIFISIKTKLNWNILNSSTKYVFLSLLTLLVFLPPLCSVFFAFISISVQMHSDNAVFEPEKKPHHILKMILYLDTIGFSSRDCLSRLGRSKSGSSSSLHSLLPPCRRLPPSAGIQFIRISCEMHLCVVAMCAQIWWSWSPALFLSVRTRRNSSLLSMFGIEAPAACECLCVESFRSSCILLLMVEVLATVNARCVDGGFGSCCVFCIYCSCVVRKESRNRRRRKTETPKRKKVQLIKMVWFVVLLVWFELWQSRWPVCVCGGVKPADAVLWLCTTG